MRRALYALAAVLLLGVAGARAQTESALNCSGTVGVTAATIAFSPPPKSYVFIANPSSSATLWLNVTGGTATASTSGSFPLASVGSSVTLPPTSAISIVSSLSSTGYTCFYH